MSQVITDKHGIQHYMITINVNGDDYTRVVKANTLLVNVLRDELDLTGTKKGCELGDCGSCTILLENKPVDSCMILAIEADGKKSRPLKELPRVLSWIKSRKRLLIMVLYSADIVHQG